MAELTPVMQKFILRWGEMGNAWGVNRTVAQIYALLYLSATPLTAEEISDTLAVARSTVSTGLHEGRAVASAGRRATGFVAWPSVCSIMPGRSRTASYMHRERNHRRLSSLAHDLDNTLNPDPMPLDKYRILRYNQNIPKRVKYG